MNDNQKAINTLKSLSAEFGRRAAHLQHEADFYKSQKEATDIALDALSQQQALERAAAVADMFKSARKNKTIFLIDGSGSMGGWPLNMPLSFLRDLQKASGKPTAGASGFWGDKNIEWNFKRDLTNDVTFNHLQRGLNMGTDMAATLIELQALAAAGKKSRQNVVIFSDGDIFDEPQSAPQLEKLLSDNPRLSWNVVLLTNRPATTMARFAEKAKEKFPKQVGIYYVPDQSSFDIVMADILKTAAPKSKNAPRP